MKTKFTLIIVSFLLSTSIYAVPEINESAQNDKSSFLKKRLDMKRPNNEITIKHQNNGIHQRINSLKSAESVKQKLVSMTYEEDGEKGKGEFEYNNAGMLTHERDYYWDEITAKMILVSISEYTYDKNNKVTEHVSAYLDESTNQFVAEYKAIYSYDNNGNMTQSIGYNLDNNSYRETKTNYKYDSKGNLIEEVLSYRNDINDQFIFSQKAEYQYNTNGMETQRIDYYFDNNFTKQWEPTRKSESSYNSSGNLISWVESTANRFNNNLTWEASMKDEYSYEATGNLAQGLFYRKDNNGLLALKEKQVSVYDDYGNFTQILYYSDWDEQTNKWDEIYKSEYTYDKNFTINELILPWWLKGGYINGDNSLIVGYNNMLTEVREFKWIDSGWVESSFYTLAYSPIEITSTNNLEIEFSNVYPNPCTDFVSISFPSNYSQISFELFDLQGRKIMSKALGNNEKVNMQGLNSGMYIYNLNVDGITQKGKLIKE